MLPAKMQGTQWSAGDVLSVRKGVVRHYGILTRRGTVLTAGPESGAREITLFEFSCGQRPKNEGYWGTLEPWQVEQRGRSLLGTPYRLLSFNCEHFVRQAHGMLPASPQLRLGVVLALMTFALTAR